MELLSKMRKMRTITPPDAICSIGIFCGIGIGKSLPIRQRGKARAREAKKIQYDKCCHSSFKAVSKCLDLHSILCLLVGSKDKTPAYDSVSLALYGSKEFKDLVQYLSSLPRISEHCSEVNVGLTSQIHDSIKFAVRDCVWGDLFSSVGSKCFTIDGELKGSALSDLSEDSYVSEFSAVVSSEFELENKFAIKLNNKDSLNVKFDETQQFKFLYTEESLYARVGKAGCIVMDFVYNLGSSEALAKTYFGMMKHQFKDNASPDTADMRTVINFCIPEVSQCPNSIAEISKIYREGNLAKKVSKHRSGVFHDKRERASKKYVVSKAVDSLRRTKRGCPYFE